jgi:Ring finger domain
MSSCCGNGECLKQVKMNVYSRTNCSHNCNLIECHNFKLCKQKRPQWVLDCDNGMCKYCAIIIGRIKFLDKKDDCSICIEYKDMIEVNCGHTFCIECWKHLSESEHTSHPLKCPLCRKTIWT